MLNKSEGKIQREKIIIYLFFTMKENFCLIKINFKKSFKKRIRKMFAMVKLRNAPFINMNQTEVKCDKENSGKASCLYEFTASKYLLKPPTLSNKGIPQTRNTIIKKRIELS